MDLNEKKRNRKLTNLFANLVDSMNDQTEFEKNI